MTWPQMVRRMQHWCPCRNFAGVLGPIAPVSSPTLHCCCCQRCAGIIAHVAWALLPLLHWHCCPCCLCVTASIANWPLPSYEAVATCAGVIASIAPLSLPALRRHCCPRRAGVFAPFALALLPLHTCVAASITNWHLASHDAVATRRWRGVVVTLNVVAHGLVAVPGIGPQGFGLQRSGQGSDGVFAALLWCPCLHCTGVIASVKLSFLFGRCCAGVCQRCALVLPASRWRHCQLCAVVLVAGVAPASLPLLCGPFCPCHAGIVALVAATSLPASQTGVCPVTKQL